MQIGSWTDFEWWAMVWHRDLNIGKSLIYQRIVHPLFDFFCFMKEEKINFGHLMAFYFHFCQRRKNLNIFPHFQQQYEWWWIFQIDFWDLQIWKGCQLKLRSLHLCWRAQLLLNQVWTRQSTGWSFFFTGSPPPKQVNLG